VNRIVLFDGECNFCDSSVQFIIKHDPNGAFHFASIQSEIGRELMTKHQVPSDVDSLVLIEDGKAYLKSTAALRIAKQLSNPWKLTSVFLILPNSLRDKMYNYVAKNRYKWFGKRDSCMLPPPHIRKRFL
jgi:predicted DCC family thiol-disulfide oxidoreductase YuxK